MRPIIGVVAASLDIVGGQGVQAHALVRQLQHDGRTVRFIPVNPRFPRRLARLRRYPYARTALNQLLYLPSLAALRHVDVVHAFSASYWSFLLAPVPAMLAARGLGKRVVLHYHSGEAEDHLGRWGARVHPWLRLAHEIVVPSDYLRTVFARFGYNVRVIRNIVDTSRFRYRDRTPLRPRLLSVRNLESHYGVDVILEAFALLKARDPQATLVVVGNGTQADRLRRLATSLGHGGIRFTGSVAPTMMPSLYEQADVLVNASLIDNQPVSILEAFAAGLPVVSTPTGDIGNMLGYGQRGVVVEPNDPPALAKAVMELLADYAAAHRLVQTARAEVERYTWAAVCDEWTAVYSGAAA